MKFKKGYANHTSGVLYAEGLWIPTTNENQQKSIEVGYAVIDCSEDEVYTPYGTKPLNSLIDQKITVYRRLGYDESQKQTLETIPAEITREEVINRGETEVRKDATSQTASRVEASTENLVGRIVEKRMCQAYHRMHKKDEGYKTSRRTTAS